VLTDSINGEEYYTLTKTEVQCLVKDGYNAGYDAGVSKVLNFGSIVFSAIFCVLSVVLLYKIFKEHVKKLRDRRGF
jgi:hypothetical protein